MGQFVSLKMPVEQWFFMSASVGHFVSGEEMGQFVWWDNLSLGRKWDILSDGTICLPKNAVGTICPWDKMSPNRWILVEDDVMMTFSMWHRLSNAKSPKKEGRVREKQQRHYFISPNDHKGITWATQLAFSCVIQERTRLSKLCSFWKGNWG